MTTMYKIRNKNTGLYCKGTPFAAMSNSSEYWSEDGKTWPTLGLLRAYLGKQAFRRTGIPESWEVVEFHIVIDAVKPPHEMIDPKVLMKILSR